MTKKQSNSNTAVAVQEKRTTEAQVLKAGNSLYNRYLGSQEAELYDERDIAIVGEYTRLKEGKNKLRVLTIPVFGTEVWVKKLAWTTDEDTGEKKPVMVPGENGHAVQKIIATPHRFKIYDTKTNEFRKLLKEAKEKNMASREKAFAAFVVMNRDYKKVQVLIVNQDSILGSMKPFFATNEDLSDYWNIDFIITKTQKKGTSYPEYKVTTSKESSLTDEEIAIIKQHTDINLEAIFEGKDPFLDYEELNEIVVEDVQQIAS